MEKCTWIIVAIYKGKDGYGYGTTQSEIVKKEFEDRASMLKWIDENGSIEYYSGYNVATTLRLYSYETYRIVDVESYEDEKSYMSFENGREFKVGDEVLHVVSDVRVTSPLKGVVKSIYGGRHMEVEFDGYGRETFYLDDMSVYKG